MTGSPAGKQIRRRGFLQAAGSAGIVAASSLAAPAVAQGRREVRMVTAWPNDFPGLGASATRLAKRITAMSGGSLAVKVFPAGALVPAFDSFDAVSNGDAEMYHAIEYYWRVKSSAFNFFAGVPFGLTAEEMNTWIYEGGGQQLWDEVAGAFNLKSFLSGNTGMPMAGWFTKPIESIDDFKSLRVAISGLGGKVLRRMGASARALSGRQVLEALENGIIDGAGWFGPWIGTIMGFQTVAKYYYYPGFQEPGTALSCGVNLEFWNALNFSAQQVIEAATAAENAFTLAEFNAHNAEALRSLEADYDIRPRKFPRELIEALGAAAGEVVAETGRGDPMASKVYANFIEFRRRALGLSKVSELAYLDARLLPFAYAK